MIEGSIYDRGIMEAINAKLVEKLTYQNRYQVQKPNKGSTDSKKEENKKQAQSGRHSAKGRAVDIVA